MDEPITFRRDFNMHIKADFKYSFIKGYTASFGGESLRMILIYYNPVLDNQVEWVQGSGQSRLVRVKKDNLGQLMERRRNTLLVGSLWELADILLGLMLIKTWDCIMVVTLICTA